MTLITREDAAELLSISTITLDRLRKKGELQYRKFGSLVRFLPEDIEEFVKNSKHSEGTKV